MNFNVTPVGDPPFMFVVYLVVSLRYYPAKMTKLSLSSVDKNWNRSTGQACVDHFFLAFVQLSKVVVLRKSPLWCSID